MLGDSKVLCNPSATMAVATARESGDAKTRLLGERKRSLGCQIDFSSILFGDIPQ